MKTKKKNKVKTYETTIRGKWIYGDAESFDSMIESLESEITMLKNMQSDGCELDNDGARDDYISVRTKDKKIAEKYGMEEEYS